MPAWLIIAFYVLFPVLAIWLCYRFEAVNKVGTVVICYIAGITMGNIGVIPESAFHVQESVAEVSVVLALPLLLFSMDVRRWTKLAGKTMLSLVLAILSVVVVSVVGFFAIRGSVEDAWKVVGMVNGLYTGGTPNLASLKTALGVDSTLFFKVHTYDTIFSIVYIVFCLTLAQRLFGLILPRFALEARGEDDPEDLETEDIKGYGDIFTGRVALGLAGALVLSAAIVGVSVGAGSLVGEASSTTVVILCITTLAIGASFVGRIREIRRTFHLGMYIIYIFCLTVGSMANARMVIDVDWALMGYVTACIYVTMVVHALLCRVFKVDVDTFIITSVSTICSPPFVPVVAGALRNRMVVLSGLTTGIIGYAIGNYLGIALGYLMRGLGQ